MNPGPVRVAWGLTLLAAPGRCIALGGGPAPGADAVAVARVLAGRHVLQGVVELASWPRLRRLGATVDALHAASMMSLAAVDRRWRRVALVDSSLASAFALLGLTATP